MIRKLITENIKLKLNDDGDYIIRLRPIVSLDGELNMYDRSTQTYIGTLSSDQRYLTISSKLLDKIKGN